jgi:hypothetical protein
MREETRSLWEQYHSDVEPWRRGRAILVTIGCGYLIVRVSSRRRKLLWEISSNCSRPASASSCLAAILFYLDWCSLDPVAGGGMGRSHWLLLGNMGSWRRQCCNGRLRRNKPSDRLLFLSVAFGVFFRETPA